MTLIHVSRGYSLSAPGNMTFSVQNQSEGRVAYQVRGAVWAGRRLRVHQVITVVFGLVVALVPVVRVRYVVGVPYLLILLSDELFRFGVHHPGDGGDGEVGAALPG